MRFALTFNLIPAHSRYFENITDITSIVSRVRRESGFRIKEEESEIMAVSYINSIRLGLENLSDARIELYQMSEL